jgi:hypothetical protein
MLLGTTLVSMGRLDEAEAHLAEVIERCEQAGDTLHLCSAYNNRIILWINREALDRAIVDQRRATALAREMAHVQLERMSTYNLAELLFWLGDLPHAHALARRARELQTRFLDESPLDALLVARVSCGLALWGADGGASPAHWARGAARAGLGARPLPARAALAAGADAGEVDRAPRRSRRRGPPRRWRALVEEAGRTALHFELQEVLHFAAEGRLREGRLADASGFLDEGGALAGSSRLWRDRFAQLPAATRDSLLARSDHSTPIKETSMIRLPSISLLASSSRRPRVTTATDAARGAPGYRSSPAT